MKTLRSMLCCLFLLMALSACAHENAGDAASHEVDTENEAASYSYTMPVYFDSEKELIETIDKLNANPSGEHDTVVISSDMAGKQLYDIGSDALKLSSITALYRSASILEGSAFEHIIVTNSYVSYRYMNKEYMDCASITWLREMTPEVAMNDLYGRGAISEREVEYDGVKYVILEWQDRTTKLSDGYTIHWVLDNKAYQASVDTGYSDEEMLAFCQLEAIALG